MQHYKLIEEEAGSGTEGLKFRRGSGRGGYAKAQILGHLVGSLEMPWITDEKGGFPAFIAEYLSSFFEIFLCCS